MCSKSVYETRPGDTPLIIAKEQLGDRERWADVVVWNAQKCGFMGPHDWYRVGTILRLPEGAVDIQNFTTCENYYRLRTQQLEKEKAELLAVLELAVDHIERTTCLHEETYRGGAIWEICRDCGGKWADDKGGKPEFKWPEHVEQARTIIARHRGQQ